MHRRPPTEHIFTKQVFPRLSDVITALHRCDKRKHKLVKQSVSVGATQTPLHLNFEATSDVIKTNIFRMEGVNFPKESSRTCFDHTNFVMESEKQANYRRRWITGLPAPFYKRIILNPIYVLICLMCMICDTVAVGLGNAVPITYPRRAVPQLQGRQTMVLMPPFDLGFRGQTSNGAFSRSRTGIQNYYNPYWRKESAQFYPDGQNTKPGPPMSLTSGYNNKYHAPKSSGYGPSFQVSHLPPQQQQQPSHDLMQNDPVYVVDEAAYHTGMSKNSPNYGQAHVGHVNSKPTFDRYNRWQPQDAMYIQTGGYSDKLYNRPEQQMSTWDTVEHPGYNPNSAWNNGYQYQPNWYDPAQVAPSWQQLPFHDLPYQNPSQQPAPQTSQEVQGYGPVYGHPSNYGEVSEAELAQRLAEYEENARKAGLLQEAGSNSRITDDLQLPQLVLPDSDKPSKERNKDKGIIISGSPAHDEMIRNFNRVAAGYNGPYGAEALFTEIDLNNDRAIDIRELKKFMQLHEIFPHH